MSDDFSGDISTTGSVAIGFPATGNFDSRDDTDWFSANLSSDVTYDIILGGVEPSLRLYDAVGQFLVRANDTDAAYARMVFQPTSSDKYYLSAATNYYNPSLRTDFTIRLTDVTDDFSSDVATIGRVGINSSLFGELEREYDEDWVGFVLAAGETVRISHDGSSENGERALPNPYLRGVYDASGTFLGSADHGENWTRATFSEFTAPSTGAFFAALNTEVYMVGQTGQYQVSIDLISDHADEVVLGTNVGEVAVGNTISEVFRALDGNDWITPGGGNDMIDGGGGIDMVSFVDLVDTPGRTFNDFRLDIDLSAGTAVNHDGSEQISLSNVERVTGTIFADRIKGDAGDNQLRGLGDYDWFTATIGEDTMNGGTGRDMISYVEWQNNAANTGNSFNDGGAPPPNSEVTGVVVDLNDTSNNTNLAAGHTYIDIERVTGSGRQDVFYGDDSENDFRGLGDYDWFVSSTGGRERYFGGDGIDTVTYYNASAGVIAGLSNGAMVAGEETGRGVGGDAALDLFFSIEGLVGTNFDDTLSGSAGRNNLSGLDGDDFIYGYAGIDVLKGGNGDDTIDGGAGSDYALYDGNRAEFTLTKTSGNEVIISGAEGTDKLIDVEYFRFADGDVTIWELSI
jgi:Ca2+-binding RTX toxin-like protein